MNYQAQILTWLESDVERMQLLQAAAGLRLNDWCLAAGFVRNLVWDSLHKKITPTPLNDIDLVYFNSTDTDAQLDVEFEQQLNNKLTRPWSVKNQARMHLRNQDAPYSSTSDAMSYWVEVETAIGVYLDQNNQLALIAPFGFKHLFGNSISINHKRLKPEEFESRVKNKAWLRLWPQLHLKLNSEVP